MVKKLGIFGLLLVMIFTLVGCGGSTNQEEVKIDEGMKKEVQEAIVKLKATDKYLIQDSIDAPDGKAYFLEAVKGGSSWTEYPVNKDTGYVDMANSDSTDYAIVDWYDVSGDAYIANSDATGKAVWYKYPKKYSSFLGSRNIMYADKLVSRLSSLEKEKETKKMDLGDGEEEFTVYKAKVKAKDLKDILGVSTLKLYQGLIDEEKGDTDDSKNIQHFAKLYLNNIEKAMVFSDGEIQFAIKDGILRQANIIVYGLGTSLSYNRSVSLKTDYKDRERPKEINSAVDYKTNLTELANFAKDYDNYNDMITAYNEKVQSEQAAQQQSESSKKDKKDKKDKKKKESTSKKK